MGRLAASGVEVSRQLLDWDSVRRSADCKFDPRQASRDVVFPQALIQAQEPDVRKCLLVEIAIDE
jgi:hypothetical protein